jgi:hypothetical protein
MIRLLAVILGWCMTPIPRWEKVEILGGPVDGKECSVEVHTARDTLGVLDGRLYRLEWRLVGGELRRRWVHLGVAETVEQLF